MTALYIAAGMTVANGILCWTSLGVALERGRDLRRARSDLANANAERDALQDELNATKAKLSRKRYPDQALANAARSVRT